MDHSGFQCKVKEGIYRIFDWGSPDGILNYLSINSSNTINDDCIGTSSSMIGFNAGKADGLNGIYDIGDTCNNY